MRYIKTLWHKYWAYYHRLKSEEESLIFQDYKASLKHDGKEEYHLEKLSDTKAKC